MDFNKSHMGISNPAIQYMMSYGFRECPALTEIKKVTKETFPKASLMMIDELEAQMFRVILKLINAKKCIEVGAFTGYNTTNMALTIPDDGEIAALDVTDKYPEVAKSIWKKYNLEKKINLIIGDAQETMQSFLDKGQAGTYDFAFIDADKTGYDGYYEKALQLLRVGGLIAIDNVFYGGKVFNDKMEQGPDEKAIHALNQKIQKDERVDTSMINIGDGVLLCRKR